MSKLKYLIISLLILFIGIFVIYTPKASASEERQYSDVLEDLKKDETFDETIYTNIADDYSFFVINLAESEYGELLIYVYQPSHNTLDLVATKVSIDVNFVAHHNELDPSIYDLELVSTNGVFDKYVVKDLKVTDDTERYYNVISIYRAFNEDIDTERDTTITNHVAFEVGQQWCFYYVNDELICEMATFETMYIDIILTDYFYADNGITLSWLYGLNEDKYIWYVAFSCDEYIIKHIYDAKLEYSVRKHTKDVWFGFINLTDEYTKWERKSRKLTDDEYVEFNGNGINGKEYIWKRIISSQDYVSTLEKQGASFKDTTKNKLLNEAQWVFSFLETDYSYFMGRSNIREEKYEVQEVAILQIHFMDNDWKIYNLGVVADITTDDGESGGELEDKSFDEMIKELEELLGKALEIIKTIFAVALLVIGGYFVIKFILWLVKFFEWWIK